MVTSKPKRLKEQFFDKCRMMGRSYRTAEARDLQMKSVVINWPCVLLGIGVPEFSSCSFRTSGPCGATSVAPGLLTRYANPHGSLLRRHIVTAKIPLSGGAHFSIVDDDDFAALSQHDWLMQVHKGLKYAVRFENQRQILMHRVLMGCAFRDGRKIDHRDGDGLNNCRDNLRDSTHSQNMRNRRKKVVSSSQYKGVHWHRTRKKWNAMIRSNKKRIWLGCFTNEADAARAYDVAAKERHGSFACLNFPDA